MDTNLYKVSKVCWAVTSSKDVEPRVFQSVDDACFYLESVGVPDEQIDLALIDMSVKGSTRANFGATRGEFIFSDNARLDGLLGVA